MKYVMFLFLIFTMHVSIICAGISIPTCDHFVVTQNLLHPVFVNIFRALKCRKWMLVFWSTQQPSLLLQNFKKLAHTDKTKHAGQSLKWVSNWCLQFWHCYTYAKLFVCQQEHKCMPKLRVLNHCSAIKHECWKIKCVKLHSDHDPMCWPCSMKSHEIHKKTVFSPMNRLYWIQNNEV